MMTLRNTISELASSFASSVLEAIRGMSLEDIIDETDGGRRGPGRPRTQAAAPSAATSPRLRPSRQGARLERRSQADISAVVDRIVELLEQHPEGLRAEQIREMLELEAKELPRPISEALEQRRITKSGQKRATTYFARGAGSGGKGEGRGGRGAAKAEAKGATKRAGAARKAKRSSGGKAGGGKPVGRPKGKRRGAAKPARGARQGASKNTAAVQEASAEEVSSGEE